jgi:hypothetical protein
MTLGSCFAQHISRHLRATLGNFLVTEPGPAAASEDERIARGFGVYTARYGNVYTIRQALQLLRRATRTLPSSHEVWEFADGVVDPHRPTVEPGGFGSAEDMLRDRESHLAKVREAFETANVVIFTVGLTETWRSTKDGLVFPLAPGVHGGAFSPSAHEFINTDYAENLADLRSFRNELARVNPTARLMLTLSPVPLAATYEPRHVLVSTSASKGILRAVIDHLTREDPKVTYFPSYEIVTMPGLAERYFEDDLRSVRTLGVEHVMRVFSRTFTSSGGAPSTTETHHFSDERRRLSDVICDEERIS